MKEGPSSPSIHERGWSGKLGCPARGGTACVDCGTQKQALPPLGWGLWVGRQGSPPQMHTKQHLIASPGVSGLGRGEGSGGFCLKGAKQRHSRARPLWQLYAKWPAQKPGQRTVVVLRAKNPNPRWQRPRQERGQAPGGETGSTGKRSWS